MDKIKFIILFGFLLAIIGAILILVGTYKESAKKELLSGKIIGSVGLILLVGFFPFGLDTN
jgi:hypothetical protein